MIFLTSVRIKKAKEFLADPQVKVYEVCYLAGYDNPTYFSTLFKTAYRLHSHRIPEPSVPAGAKKLSGISSCAKSRRPYVYMAHHGRRLFLLILFIYFF